MATESIFHNIVINDRESAERFVSALEAAEKAAKKNPYRHSGSRVLTPDEVAAIKPKLRCKITKV